MRATFLLALTALALASAAAPATAQQPEEQVVVTARPSEEVVRAFVNQMSIAPGVHNQLARWDRKICPGVAGLRPRYAQFILDRMAQRASGIGLDVGEPGCRANILIVVTPDPAGVARYLADDLPRAMGVRNEIGRTSLGRRALQRFVSTDAPVRWWHVNRTVTRDGDIISRPARPTMVAGSFDPIDAPITNISGGASLLRRTTRQDFGWAFVVVDARALERIDLDWAALADYLAMVTLAQLDPEAETAGYPTILNLFAGNGEGVRTLTDWDAAYLRGLYGATREAASVGRQEGEIARSMGRDLTRR